MEQPREPQPITGSQGKLASELHTSYEQYKKDRRPLEDRWMKNLRQYRGVIDPDLESRMTQDQSRAYPKLTRHKVTGMVARLMQMLFPNSDQLNWDIQPGEVPDIEREELEQLLEDLEAQFGQDVSDKIIEDAIMAFAKDRARRMKQEMRDQLAEMKYDQTARAAVNSGVIYGPGIVKGPLVRKKLVRSWQRGSNGKFSAVEKEINTPWFQPVSCWNLYTDLSAKEFAAIDGHFERHIMSRSQLANLMNRPDFDKKAIRKYLKEHKTGNYKEEWWEVEMRAESSDRENIQEISDRKYEVWEYTGMVRSEYVPEADQEKEMCMVNFWGIDSVVIKSVLLPRTTNMYHFFIYEHDDLSLLGVGLAEIFRDTQLSINAATRMMFDNASVVAGPILEIDESLLIPGQEMDIHAFKIFYTEENPSGRPAVKQVNINSHLNELQSIVNMYMDIGNLEVSLPPPSLGDPSQGGSEALRTARGASMIMGAANLPIRDVVRNFDDMTESVMEALYDWNMAFNKTPNIRGDFNIKPLGAASLLSKEIRASMLNEVRQNLTEDDEVFIERDVILRNWFDAIDLPQDALATPEKVQERQAARAEQAARAQAIAEEKVRAEIREVLTSAVKNIALANKADSSAANDTLNTILQGLTGAINAAGEDNPQQGS